MLESLLYWATLVLALHKNKIPNKQIGFKRNVVLVCTVNLRDIDNCGLAI